MEEKPQKQALLLAMKIANKKKSHEEPKPETETSPMAEGGKCYACGGMVGKGYSEGGGVDMEDEDEEIEGLVGDELEDSPEVGASDFKENNEEADEEDKKNSFLRSFMVSRRLRGMG